MDGGIETLKPEAPLRRAVEQAEREEEAEDNLDEEEPRERVAHRNPFLQKSATERAYDAHPKAIFGTTMLVSAIVGVKLNEHVGGTVTALELQPSTAASAGLLAASLVAKKIGYPRTSQVALAAGLGQGLATVSAHVPKGALMSGGGGSPKV